MRFREEIMTFATRCGTLAMALGLSALMTPLATAQEKHKVFLSMSYIGNDWHCLLYTSPSPRDQRGYRMPSSA